MLDAIAKNKYSLFTISQYNGHYQSLFLSLIE